MKRLLQHAWQYRHHLPTPLRTTDGRDVEILDAGQPATTERPDFCAARLRLEGALLTGDVVCLWRADDAASRAEATQAMLLVTRHADNSLPVPQIEVPIPEHLEHRYRDLLAAPQPIACQSILSSVPTVSLHAWLNTLAAERLQTKTKRIEAWLRRTGGDWERTCFLTLARGFGFGGNSAAFERWAEGIDLSLTGKHRDNAFQIEAYFLGQAGLLAPELVAPERRDDHYTALCREYDFLRHKFGLTPMAASAWHCARLRPQNAPHLRLAQLAELYVSRRLDFSRLRTATDADALRQLLHASALPYWRTHYAFGLPSAESDKTLRSHSLDALLINVVAPLLMAYGRSHNKPALTERAITLLETVKPENNAIVRAWAAAGVKAESAADTQGLLTLHHEYCTPRACLRCRFGAYFLRQ